MAGFFGLGNYQNSGAGIAKDRLNKSRFKMFFEILSTRIWKLFSLNFLYVIFCIPIITIGPATAGITKVLKNYSIDKNAYVWSDFISTFKKNFLKTFILGLFDLIAYAGVATGCYIYPKMSEASGNKLFYVLFVLTLSVAVTFTIMNFYMYLMIVSTDLSMKNIIKNSLVLTFLAPKQNLLSLFLMVIISAIFLLLPLWNLQFLFLMLFVPATFIVFIICYNCYPVIQKYVINPYYEKTGKVNPESPEAYEESLFEDMGGKETPIELKKSKKGRTIS